MKEIKDLRDKIDQIDDKIMSLLDERYKISHQIGVVKKQENIVILDTNREDYILNKTSKYSHSPQIESIYRTIMEESKKAQKKV